jgi:hypothetical protein
MSGLKIEAFLSAPVCTNSTELVRLLGEVGRELGEAIEVVIYDGPTEMSEEYHVTSTPAVVVEGLVKMMGFCPSKESLISALKEVGLE